MKFVSKDRLTKARRSWNMSRIRGKHTTPEKVVRSALHRMGFRFRLHVRIPTPTGSSSSSSSSWSSKSKSVRNQKTLSASPGDRVPRSGLNAGAPKLRELGTHWARERRRFVQPDIVLPKHKTAIFVHGCFWHRHKGCRNCTTPTNRQVKVNEY